MKFKLKITKEVIDKSLMCGTNKTSGPAVSCAFAVAYNELIPNTFVYYAGVSFSKKVRHKQITIVALTDKQREFIDLFDLMNGTPTDRYPLVGQEFDVEIPDEVIGYWYGDLVKAAQKIIDNPILQIV